MTRKEISGDRNRFVLLIIVLVVIISDQLAKLAIRQSLALNESTVLIPKVLSLTYITNTGAVFGMFRGMNTVLIAIGIAVVMWLLYHTYTEAQAAENKNLSAFLALIIGGAISNIIDRIAYGSVIDFIDFHFWPAFNIADSAVTIGVAAIIVSSLKNVKLRKNKE
ncbi:signal peptidase II [Candidatus Woesearchaeota archaeon]|nr:signal peptidase II [Candidatus Woesearchaeota archaeon]